MQYEYAITIDGVRAINRFNEAKDIFSDFIDSDINTKISKLIEQTDCLVNDFETLLSDLGKIHYIGISIDHIDFVHDPRLRFTNMDIAKSGRGLEEDDEDSLLEDLAEQGWIEKLEIEEEQSFLGEVRELLVSKHDLVKAINIAMENKTKEAVVTELKEEDGDVLDWKQIQAIILIVSMIDNDTLSQWEKITNDLIQG